MGSLTFVKVSGALTGMAAAVGATLLLRWTLPVAVAALHAGRCEATSSLWRRAASLLRRQHGLEELTAGNALPVLFREDPLREEARRAS